MEAGLLRDALVVLLGVITGMLSAAFGVGGAVLSTPGVRVLGVSALVAVGTTLPSILPSAASGTARYWRE
ncbi:MAG: TSUP family transporter, partial [Actinobacteria bacterium]|nr:TSUP family transporter [Actinomycetota bacterium]